MKHFTSEELKPSEQTLCIIRQIARSCQVLKSGNAASAYCLN